MSYKEQFSSDIDKTEKSKKRKKFMEDFKSLSKKRRWFYIIIMAIIVSVIVFVFFNLFVYKNWTGKKQDVLRKTEERISAPAIAGDDFSYESGEHNVTGTAVLPDSNKTLKY
ncbi:MAG: hypothetical protein LBD41_01925 [Clostridiales Family XIII bacterium]|jgi:cell division protein FtsL|nr:hypothetical protein [Clostridiales Family XIII bacterium]